MAIEQASGRERYLAETDARMAALDDIRSGGHATIKHQDYHLVEYPHFANTLTSQRTSKDCLRTLPPKCSTHNASHPTMARSLLLPVNSSHIPPNRLHSHTRSSGHTVHPSSFGSSTYTQKRKLPMLDRKEKLTESMRNAQASPTQ